MPRSDASGSKRFQGWTKRRFLPFGSAFCRLTPEVAFPHWRTRDQWFFPGSSVYKRALEMMAYCEIPAYAGMTSEESGE
jgi:hypothetical protein